MRYVTTSMNKEKLVQNIKKRNFIENCVERFSALKQSKNQKLVFLSRSPLFVHVFGAHRALEYKLQCFLIDYNTFGGV